MEDSNVTLELCEALSKLTRSEWTTVKYRMDSYFEKAVKPLYEPCHEKAGAMTCGVTAPDLLVLLNR